jgi:hypothetical protein
MTHYRFCDALCLRRGFSFLLQEVQNDDPAKDIERHEDVTRVFWDDVDVVQESYEKPGFVAELQSWDVLHANSEAWQWETQIGRQLGG